MDHVESTPTHVEIRLSTSFYVLAVLSALFTFGVALVIFWWGSRSYPRSLDDEGVTTRGGQRYEWASNYETLKLQGGSFRMYFRDHFREGSVSFVLRFMDAPYDVLMFLQERRIDTGLDHRATS